MRTDTTELGEARRRVEQLVVEMADGREQLSFSHPWELRAFALAVAAHQNGYYDWSEFQMALIGAIRRWEGSPEDAPWRYYERWLEALETVLSGTGVLEDAEVDQRSTEFRATPAGSDHHHPARREPVAIDPAR